MAIHEMTLGIDGSGIHRSKKITSTDGGVVLLDGETVVVSTDTEINLDLDISALKSFYLESNLDVLVEINTDVGVGGSISLRANEPYVWHTNSYDSFLFAGTAGEITSIFVTNAAGATATLYCVALFDPAL